MRICSCTVEWNWGCERTGNSENILNPITSARLHTVNTFGFTYGKVEARARIPAGDWIWPGQKFTKKVKEIKKTE
jgi:beta-glucanase (GH16 family)